MTIIADAGPVLHLFWVGAQEWALPQQPIHIVPAVWDEVRHHAPEALAEEQLLDGGRLALGEFAPEKLTDVERDSMPLSIGRQREILQEDRLLADDGPQGDRLPSSSIIKRGGVMCHWLVIYLRQRQRTMVRRPESSSCIEADAFPTP